MSIKVPPLVLPIYPEMKSFQDELEKEVTGASKEAGQKGGEELGKELAAETEKSFKKRFNPEAVRNVMLGGLAVGGALIAGAYQVGKEFDAMSDNIRVGTGATGEQLEMLEESARNVGKTSIQSFEEVGTVVADVNTRLGLTGGELEAVSTAILRAQELGQELDINTVTGAMRAFGVENADIADQMDSLYRVSQATGVGMNELAQTALKAAPQLTNLGFSFEESAAMIGAMNKAGIDASKITRGLRTALVKLAQDGEDPETAFRRITGEIESLVIAGKDAEAIGLATDLFGSGNATNFVAAVQSGQLSIDAMYESLGATEDTLGTAAEDTRDFEERLAVLGNIAADAFEPFATEIFTAFGDALVDLTPHIEAFSGWLKDNTWAIWAFAAIIGGVVLTTMGLWIGSIWAANAALLANPITWIVLLIAALITALVLLIANWESVWTAVTGFMQDIVAWIDTAIAATGRWIQDLLEAIGLVEEAGSLDISTMTDAEIEQYGNGASAEEIRRNAAGGSGNPFEGWNPFEGLFPGLATGGTVTKPGSVLVGERGPEILDLPAGASVIPLEKTGSTYNITNYYPQAEPTSTTVRKANQLAVA